jgi:V/A-type H+-transporting ATPase subunit I
MMRVRAIVLAQDERKVLKGLGALGAVHLTRTRSDPDTALLSPTDYTGELARYDRIRTRVQTLRQSLEVLPLPDGQREHEERAVPPGLDELQAPLPAMTLDQAEAALVSVEQRSTGLLEHRQRLEQRQKELAAVCDQVSCYRGFEIPLTGLDQFSFLHFVTGSLPEQNLEGLEKEVGDNVALLPLAQQKGRQRLFAITTRQGQPALEKALQQAGFQREALPVVEGSTVDRMSEETQREQEKLMMELVQLNGRIKTVAAELAPTLAGIEGFVDMECQLLEASQKFPRTETTVLIAGWAPVSDVGILKQHMEEITVGRYVLEAVPPDALTGEEAPVLLRHSWLLRPFEMLVAAYGLPNYRELEPTLFVALSYIVMFGMMFGDVGHGAVLAACGLIALIRAGRPKKVQDIGVLLVSAGLSSIIFGAVYGSYFGIEALKKYAIWHDPLEGDPIQLMYGAIGIGIAMISTGLILNVVNRFRKGDIIGGILDKFGLIGLLFYWGTLVILIYGATIRSWGLMGVCIILFLAVPIIGWSVKEPIEHFMSSKAGGHGGEHGGMAGAVIESCVGAFEAILSYLANTISFVRLAAYAMSHAALLFAAFMVAEEVKGSAGGGVWSLLVIIFGNLIAIVLEGVIASVQALRLEYYEFFGKFFSGGGEPFEPFRLAPGGAEDKQGVTRS